MKGIHAIIDAIDSHGPLLNLVEPRNQLDQRRFTASRKSDERDFLTLWNLQVDALQHWPAGHISEDHIVE